MRLVSADERARVRRETSGPLPAIRERNDDALNHGLTNDALRNFVIVKGRVVKEGAPWFELECSHYTNYDVQETYRLWKPKRHVFYCESCCKWNPAKTPSKPKPTPVEPMF
jgi:hypothetical protein